MHSDALDLENFQVPGFFERFFGAILGKSRPLDCVQIEVTSKCVGGCVYCPQEAQKSGWKSRHMDDAIFAMLWPLLLRTNRAHLQGWGEPLLHPRFFDFQTLANRAGCATSTTSAGLAMNEDLATRLAQSGMDLIAYSVTGTDAGSNSARSKIPFEQVCASIRTLRKAIADTKSTLEIHLAYLLLADRVNAVTALPQLMEDLGVDMAVISTLDYLAVPDHKNLAFAPNQTDDIAKAREILERAAAEAERRGRIIHFALPGPDAVPEGCRENIGKSLYVDAEGQISPCIYRNVPGTDSAEQRLVFGNVQETNPMTIWQAEDFRNFRKRLLRGEADAICQNCPKHHEW